MSDRAIDAREQGALRRYSNVAVTFHWVTAVLVLFQIWLGLIFADMAQGPERANLFTWHRTIGALILLIVLARLSYRLMNPPPPYPPELPRWERVAGTWNHRLFYLLLIAMPIIVQVYFNSGLTYLLMKWFRVEHSVAAPGALIGASNFFELAVAVAITLFGADSPAALATVVGVLVEVPVMLSVCKVCNRTRGWFRDNPN